MVVISVSKLLANFQNFAFKFLCISVAKCHHFQMLYVYFLSVLFQLYAQQMVEVCWGVRCCSVAQHSAVMYGMPMWTVQRWYVEVYSLIIQCGACIDVNLFVLIWDVYVIEFQWCRLVLCEWYICIDELWTIILNKTSEYNHVGFVVLMQC